MPRCSSLSGTSTINANGSTTTNNNSNTSSSVSSSFLIAHGEIPLKVRINGDAKSILTFGLAPTQQFRILIQKFHNRPLSPSTTPENLADCKFEFDGEVLNPLATPEDEDLEGGEMIDVTTAVKATKKKKKQQDNGLRRNATRSSTRSLPAYNDNDDDDDCQVVREIITVQTSRNNHIIPLIGIYMASAACITQSKTGKPKRFRLYSTDTFETLKEGYVKFYKKKGCRNVKFYFKNSLIVDIKKTLAESGVENMDSICAIENGKKYVAI